MELDHAEDTFCENIAELWACIDKILQFESDDSGYGFNAYFEHVSETNWVRSQTLTYKRLQIFLQDRNHLKSNRTVLRIFDFFSLLEGTSGDLMTLKNAHAKAAKGITARTLLEMQVKKRRQRDDVVNDQTAKLSKHGGDDGRNPDGNPGNLHAQWQAIDRLATLLSR